MKQLANMRPARAGETLTRFVKEPGRHAKPSRVALMPADATNTRFPARVVDPGRNPLVSGHSNIKIGRDVRKGKLRGYWIYTLSLEERATCPTSCHHWRDCFGNAMPLGKRVRHGPDMLEAIDAQLGRLLAVKGRRGVLVRLHALGDFYSVEYVHFWRRMLEKYDRLAVFGYTAHHQDDWGSGNSKSWGISLALELTRGIFSDRFMVRASDAPWPTMSTVSIAKPDDCPPDAFVCPEQTGRTLACATCAACWSTTKNVAFIGH